MGTIYLIIAAGSFLAVAVGVILYTYFYERIDNTEGENCLYDPSVKDRACCKKIEKLHADSALKL